MRHELAPRPLRLTDSTKKTGRHGRHPLPGFASPYLALARSGWLFRRGGDWPSEPASVLRPQRQKPVTAHPRRPAIGFVVALDLVEELRLLEPSPPLVDHDTVDCRCDLSRPPFRQG